MKKIGDVIYIFTPAVDILSSYWTVERFDPLKDNRT